MALPTHTTHVHNPNNTQEYFNTEGFQRWNKIYSDTAEVNKVQADIRCVFIRFASPSCSLSWHRVFSQPAAALTHTPCITPTTTPTTTAWATR